MKSKQPVELRKTDIKIIKLICRQYSSKEIGVKLGMSLRTVEDYRAHILKKTKARNAIGIVLYAIRNGLFTP